MPTLADESTPRILIIGAHPDDAEIKAAGTAVLWARAGARVTFASVTDGSAGHHEMPPRELAERRRHEAMAAARVLGVGSEILGYPDGRLEPTLAARLDIVRLIRRQQPDLVLTHRPNDYHPDHRYTSQLVQDAAYLVTVPHVATETPFLKSNPVFGYLSDRFTKPLPFQADVVVPIDGAIDRVIDALDCHASQFYEWLPFNMGILNDVPADPTERRKLLEQWYRGAYARRASDFSSAASSQEIVEAFEISEYGSPLTPQLRERLFPFRTASASS